MYTNLPNRKIENTTSKKPGIVNLLEQLKESIVELTLRNKALERFASKLKVKSYELIQEITILKDKVQQ